ncbi:hypothetical protein [Polaribacter sargassicola]|nr:hypothetical protein [Polaribacter sp. DS7-9]MCG1035074.1 hypothetical protein [Polaribacter sp. DS7-9]
MMYKKTLLYDREAAHSFSASRKLAKESLVKKTSLVKETVIKEKVLETV